MQWTRMPHAGTKSRGCNGTSVCFTTLYNTLRHHTKFNVEARTWSYPTSSPSAPTPLSHHPSHTYLPKPSPPVFVFEHRSPSGTNKHMCIYDERQRSASSRRAGELQGQRLQGARSRRAQGQQALQQAAAPGGQVPARGSPRAHHARQRRRRQRLRFRRRERANKKGRQQGEEAQEPKGEETEAKERRRRQ